MTFKIVAEKWKVRKAPGPGNPSAASEEAAALVSSLSLQEARIMPVFSSLGPEFLSK